MRDFRVARVAFLSIAAAGALVLTVAAFLPLARCPNCRGTGLIEHRTVTKLPGGTAWVQSTLDCRRCTGSGRLATWRAISGR